MKRHVGKHACSCGCGEIIEILPIHHKRGIPAFIKGHNFISDFNPRLEEDVVIDRKSVIWEMLSDEEKERRLANLKRFGKREEHPYWKGGRIYDDNGYIKIRLPEHPHATDGYIQEHRLVMEGFLSENFPNSPYLMMISGKLYLRPEVVVHHVNEVKDDNRIENLFPFPDGAAHVFWHKSSLPDDEKIRRIKLGLYRTHVDEEKLNTNDEPTNGEPK